MNAPTTGTGAAGAAGSHPAGGAGAAAAGSGGAGPTGFKRPCLDSGNEVVFIGDSYSNYAVAHTALAALVAQRAQQDGALPAAEKYRDYAVAGTTLAAQSNIGTIPPQWESAKSTKPIKAVIMDGGGNDVVISNMQCLPAGSDKNASCQMVAAATVAKGKELIQDMKATGVSDVIWFWYPHRPNGNGTAINDYTYPMLEALAKSVSTDTFHVFVIDTVPIFEGHPEYIYTDGIHANDMGEAKIADAIYKLMKDNCIAQPESKGCCMP